MIENDNDWRTAARVLDPSFVRDDHCDGRHGLYRLSACSRKESILYWEVIYRYRYGYVTDRLRSLCDATVRPNRIFIHDDMVEIDWYPQEFQMVMSRVQYAGLVLQFEEFLLNLSMPEIATQEGCFNDDPDDEFTTVTDKEINIFPEFNSKCFGRDVNEPIEVLCFTDEDRGDALWL